MDVNVGAIVDHEKYGKGKVLAVEEAHYLVDFGKLGNLEISKNSTAITEVMSAQANDNTNRNMEELEKMFIRVLNDYSDIQKPIELGERWKGGKMVLHPENPSQKGKEIPIETFFHKIVMVRDRLRVLEQNINSNSKLSDEEKVNMQQYITRIYGSLTTFNILFASDEDHFVGDKSE
jgi:hypothetical protein